MSYKEQWRKLLMTKRLGKEKSTGPEEIRTDFQRDYDRIIFSNAFRRLGKKTQVHPFASNDHIHSRLTHSLEVSSVGRSLGLKAGALMQNLGDMPDNYSDADIATIVQVASLAHDIRNPPFGHAGEYAIRHWFESEGERYLHELSMEERRDFERFEGNAQGFRILTKLEERFMRGGMRLTYASLGSVVKYPWTSSLEDAKKFNIFQSEKEIFQEIFSELGLIRDGVAYRHPLSYLMEAADDICYKILDLEDAVELSIIPYEKAKDVLKKIILLTQQSTDSNTDTIQVSRRAIGKLRAKAIHSFIVKCFEEYENNYEKIMEGEYEGALLDGLAKQDKKVDEILKEIDNIYKENIFATKKKVEVEIGAYEIISILLSNFMEAVQELDKTKDFAKLTFKHQKVLELIDKEERPSAQYSLYENILRITDFISGMTDNYATYLAHQMSGNFHL